MLNKLLAHNQVTLGQQLLSSQYTIHNCSWWDLKTSLLLAFKLWIICIFVVKNVEMYAKTRRVWVHSSMVLSAFIVVEYTRPWFLHAYRWFLVWECVCNSACVGGSRASWKRAGVKHTSLSIHSEIKRYMCWWQPLACWASITTSSCCYILVQQHTGTSDQENAKSLKAA